MRLDWVAGDGGGGTIMGIFRNFFTEGFFIAESRTAGRKLSDQKLV